MSMNSVGNFLGNDGFAKFAKGTAGAVYVMTGIKAVGRPYFIYKDKNTDEGKKKYAATSEFLYQVICFLITVGMIPVFKSGSLKFAAKHLKGHESKFLDEGFAVLKKEAEEKAKKSGKAVKEIIKPKKLNKKFFESGAKSLLKPYKEASHVLEEISIKVKNGETFDSKKLAEATTTKNKLQSLADAAHNGLGSIEMGSFVGSIIGLTLLAPPIAHALTHPIMKFIGMDKKESANSAAENLQQPLLSEGKNNKVDTNA